MGGISSKNTKKNNLVKVESIEQFSVWRTTILAKGSFNREDGKAGEDVGISPSSTHTMQFCSLPHPPTTGGGASIPMKLRFFLRKFEKCVGIDDDDDNNVTLSKGYSLWMSVDTDDDDGHNYQNDREDDVIFSVKIKKTVNGQEESNGVSMHHHQNVVVITLNGNPKEFLLDENFLILGFQQRNLKDGKVKKNVTLLGNLIKLKVDFAVKMLYASENSYGDEIEVGQMRHVNLPRKLEGSGFLVKDLKKLYTGEVLTDVVLKASDDMVVKAHKAILAARSPYFSRLIQWNQSSFSKDKSTVPFPIDDVSGRPLLAVVHWMYTGELMDDVGVDKAALEEMMTAARKFEMGELVKVLEKWRQVYGGSQCSSCCVVKKNGDGMRELGIKSDCKDAVKKIKRAVLAWFPLLRYRFGSRQVGLVQSIINAVY